MTGRRERLLAACVGFALGVLLALGVSLKRESDAVAREMYDEATRGNRHNRGVDIHG